VAYLQDCAAGMRLRLGTRVRRVDRAGGGWELRLGRGGIRAAHVVIATGPDAEPVMPGWPGMATFPGTVIHAGQFRNVREMTGLDVLVVGPGNSGVDLLGHLAGRSGGAANFRGSARMIILFIRWIWSQRSARHT
jgi:cation diffusion facilitator CzcD-associated flavoprotein CzcO